MSAPICRLSRLSAAPAPEEGTGGAQLPGGGAVAEADDAGSAEESDLTESRIRRLHGAAEAEISAALQPFGYYEPAIEARLERAAGDWIAHYAVSSGTMLTTVQIEVLGEGADEPAVRAARGRIQLAPGEVLNHARYEAAKQVLFDAAYGAGFIDAAYRRSELRVRRRAREADIHLLLDTGPRYYFGDVTVVQDILDSSVIERFVPIRPGEPFDADRLVQLQIQLGDSGYFSEVAVDVERERAVERHIPVIVHTAPRATQEYTVGLGYGTDTGPRVSIGVELRRLNAQGHRFNADLRLSSIEQAVAAEYRIPRGRNLATDFLGLRGTLGNHELGGWDTRQLTAGAAWHDAWRSFQRRLYATGLREEFWTSGTAPAREELVFAGIQLTSKNADDPIYPQQGFSAISTARRRGAPRSSGRRRWPRAPTSRSRTSTRRL